MRAHGPNKAAPTLVRYASAITRSKRNVRSCWLKSLTSFKLRATTRKSTQCCVRMHGALRDKTRARDQLPVALIAQLVEQFSAITRPWVRAFVEGCIFSQPFLAIV